MRYHCRKLKQFLIKSKEVGKSGSQQSSSAI
jgi:hypothetical protein